MTEVVYAVQQGKIVADILDKIVATKRQEIIEGRQKASIDDLRRQIADLAPPRDFFGAIVAKNTKRLNLIAEIKKASPSAGVICKVFDPIRIAKEYHAASADCLSVLTDEQYFQGKLEYVQQVKNVVSLPVLRKDFIVDPWQVYQTRACGADAMLLIAECLTPSEIASLHAIAIDLGLTVLIEVHDPVNFDAVNAFIASLPKTKTLLGINNRDLRVFKTDLNTTIRLAEKAHNREILVSESGIATREDIDRLFAAGVRATLVGETLMRTGNVKQTVRDLYY